VSRMRVWAPRAAAVDLVVGDGATVADERFPMADAGGGWWAADAPAGHGVRYGFSLDGGPVRPDPRSRSQPDGVHGRSEIVDLERLRPPGGPRLRWRGIPLPGAVLYEMHVGTFTAEGTFAAAARKLGHLVELGVDAVELMPVAAFPGVRGWGYDGVDLYAPHAPYGGPAGLVEFVDACHDAGLGVVADVVYNHLGPSGNYLGEFGPYFSDGHQTNWGAAVNLDGPGSDEVRRFFIDNALMWLGEYGIDGLRLDAVHALIDDSAVHFLEQLSEEVEALAAHLGRSLFLVAESDRNDPRYVNPRALGGYGLDASWADEWHHAVHAVLTSERAGYYRDFGSLGQLATALERAWVYAGQYSEHRGRVHGRSPVGLSGHRFVVSVQNHDQVGNRATGERLGALTNGGQLRVAAALLLTSPFTPLLFQGEEWGAGTPFRYFTDHDDPDLARAVTDGRRFEFASFGWRPDDIPDPQDPATHESSVLDWDELSADPHDALLDWYAELIVLRRARPELTDGRWDAVRCDVGPDATAATGWIRFRRGRIEVAANLGTDDENFTVAPESSLLLASDDRITLSDGELTVPPDTVAIIEAPQELLP
jgi:maltooligosyltrehalose trehalohydrolase